MIVHCFIVNVFYLLRKREILYLHLSIIKMQGYHEMHNSSSLKHENECYSSYSTTTTTTTFTTLATKDSVIKGIMILLWPYLMGNDSSNVCQEVVCLSIAICFVAVVRICRLQSDKTHQTNPLTLSSSIFL